MDFKGSIKPEKTVKHLEVDKLDIGKVWYQDYDLIKFNRIVGKEHYYPVYRWDNYISFSPLNLIKLKGGLNFNPKIDNYLNSNLGGFNYLPPSLFIDRDIERIGNVVKPRTPLIGDTESFLNLYSEALIKDIRYLEGIHEQAIFGIMVGGKDSLNLLLLPWKKPVVALSAEPNYDLVKEFCKENELKIEVRKLGTEENDTPERLAKDILINCSRVNLADIRWTEDLNEMKSSILSEFNKELIVLTGNLADTFLTPNFRSYRSKWQNSYLNRLRYKFQDKTRVYLEQIWYRGAQWQGIYQGILRESTDIRNYSAYQGFNAIEILRSSDLEKVIKKDVRSRLGSYLANKAITYPATNPSPPSWEHRNSQTNIRYFNQVLESFQFK